MLNFVRGHCGWDTLTLLRAEDVPEDQRLNVALRVMDPPTDGGIEVCYLGPRNDQGQIPVQIINAQERDWIAMCGGMTQVIGKAIVESPLCDYYQVDKSRDEVTIVLSTQSSLVPIRSEIDRGRVKRVWSDLSGYLAFLTQMGKSIGRVDEIPFARVGYYIMIEISELASRHPNLDFRRRDDPAAWSVLDEINQTCRAVFETQDELYIMLFDFLPTAGGDVCIYPRFYPFIQWEFQCGTGSVAALIGITMLHPDVAMKQDGELVMEWGNPDITPDPYGVRTSVFRFDSEAGEISSVQFSHSVIEILSIGLLQPPAHGEHQDLNLPRT